LSQQIRIDRHGQLRLITIHRPEVRNALSIATSHELAAAFDDFEADSESRAAILTGSGSADFCAGGDLRGGQAKAESPGTGFGGLTWRFDRTKPIIAAVNGRAFGGGIELALACDLILAAEHASFALPEPKRGLAAMAGGLHRLPRAIGEKRALGIILTAREVSAAEGARLGFVTEVVAADKLPARAFELAEAIAALSPMAIGASLECVRRGLDIASLEEAMRAQAQWPAVAAWRRSDDRKEGIAAFREKRLPVWRGR
jgi:crotonobetainyl-CoA hydratase